MVLGKSLKQLHGSEFLPLAHHPHCERHENHLLWVLGKPRCLGCVCLYGGVVVGVVFAFLLRTPVQLGPFALLLTLLVAPTGLQPFFQRKWFKALARTAVGVASGGYGVGLLLFVRVPGPRAFWILGGTVWFALVVRAMLWLRARFPSDPCVECPLGVYPTCAWNIERLLNGNESADLSAALLEINREGVAKSRPPGVTATRGAEANLIGDDLRAGLDPR